MTSRFASLTEQDIEKIVEDKDSQNTKRSTKVAKELFANYVKDKKLREPEEKKELAQIIVNVARLDFQKKILGSAGPQVFNFVTRTSILVAKNYI